MKFLDFLIESPTQSALLASLPDRTMDEARDAGLNLAVTHLCAQRHKLEKLGIVI